MPVGEDGETCWSVIARAAAGDGPSRSAFGRLYLPLVRAFLVARWRGTARAAQVDEAVQDVFVECFRPDGSLARAGADRGDFRSPRVTPARAPPRAAPPASRRT